VKLGKRDQKVLSFYSSKYNLKRGLNGVDGQVPIGSMSYASPKSFALYVLKIGYNLVYS
jgi:hypothetical protein